LARAKALVAWSSGKDAAWALHLVRQEARVEPVGLLVTITELYQRSSMHGVRRELVEAQARAIGLPLVPVLIPAPCSNEAYESAMAGAMARARAEGVSHVVFGDIFLADVRAYREEKLAPCGIRPLFPLWGRDTRSLLEEMLAGGLRARVTCLDPRVAPREMAGRELDEAFLASLPEGVDPCGERGEFHTFAFDGPVFDWPIEVEVGETVEREGFVFTDLVPAFARRGAK